MKTLRIPAPEILLCCLLLLAAPLLSQRPPAPGKLYVTSTRPSKITIDGQATGQVTPFTFAISPGEHSVSLTGGPKCKNSSNKVNVASGATASVNCDGATGCCGPITK
jgi:hypothetical protein